MRFRWKGIGRRRWRTYRRHRRSRLRLRALALPRLRFPRLGRGPVAVLSLLILLVGAGWSLWRVDRAFRPSLLAIAEMKAKAMAADAVNEAISPEVLGDVKYDRLVHFQLNTRGDRVLYMQPDTVGINLIADRATRAVRARLAALDGQPVAISLAQVLGWSIFAGRGPALHLRIEPIGLPITNVRDRFEAAGINQTRHLIYLETTVAMRMVAPAVSREVDVSFQTPLTSAVINGEVPDYWPFAGYLGRPQGNSGSEPAAPPGR